MKIQSLIVFICRTEVEKTPKIVFPHEVDVLREVHGHNRIEMSDAKSPLGEVEVDLEAEYQRLLDEYNLSAANGGQHPVVAVYGSFDEFCDAVQEPKASKRGRKARDTEQAE